MTYKKFLKEVEKYFVIEKTEKISKKWFNAYAKSIYTESKEEPNYQIQYKKDEKIWKVGGIEGKSLIHTYLDWLEGNKEATYREMKWHWDRETMFNKMWYEESIKYLFYSVIHNEKETIVRFANWDRVKVKRIKGAKDDVYTAVAFAIVKRLFGTNSHFQKYVDKYLEEISYE